MNIPEGKTCGNCFHLKRCVSLYGVKAESITCGWTPSRYQEKVQVTANYALVELIGRQQIAGFVSDAMIDGSPFIKVEVPATKVHRKYTCYFSIESVYAISPMQEAQVTNITAVRELGRFPEIADSPGNEERSRMVKGHGQVVSNKKGKRVL